MTIEELRAKLEVATRERDEARAYAEDRNDEANKLQRFLNMTATERDEARADANMLEDRLSESRAEVERLTDERDELLVRVANQEAELRATREAYREARTEVLQLKGKLHIERIGIRLVDEVRSDAYRRGAEAMRDEVDRLTDERDELLVRVADQGAELRATRELVWTRESAERALREIGILEEP